ncbi:DUF732 domain-containing protein [Streptomyces sp. NPDC002138]|uniref:DUF732 domain-containing protein n=1 Tax=Streptomyces sp. NPDC002138 TaxID=3154410 RepID=UPI0033196E47
MNRRTTTVLLTAVLAAACLTACGTDQDGVLPPAGPRPVSTPAPPPPPPAATGKPGKSGGGAAKEKELPPWPDAAAQDRYISALTAIDPDIVHNKPDKAVDRGRNLCQSIARFPGDRKRQTDLANQRFGSPAHPTGFGPAKAANIVDAVHTHLCPAY